MKKTLAIVFVLIITFSLTACDSNKSTAETLLMGTLENDVKSNIIDGYLSSIGRNIYDAERERTGIQSDMVRIMQYWYGYDEDYNDLSDGITDDFIPVYQTLLEQFEYTVSEVEKNESGNYYTTITYKPILLGDALDPIAEEYYANPPEFDGIGMTEEILIGKHNRALFALLLEEAERFSEDIQYGEEKTFTYTISLDDNLYYISDKYYEEFLPSIIDLNFDEQE